MLPINGVDIKGTRTDTTNIFHAVPLNGLAGVTVSHSLPASCEQGLNLAVIADAP